jgi:hypothetical protein
MLLTTLVASTFVFIAFMITALEPRLTARSIRLMHSRGQDPPGS